MNREKTRSLAMSGGLLGALLLVCLLALLPAAPTGALAQSAPAPPPPAAAPRWPTGTVITEDVTVNTTWTLAGSPYQLAANIAVAPGVTLRLDPGVTVEADGVGLDVAGTLLAQGTITQPVTFTGASPTPGIWDGIRIHGTAQTPNTGSMLAHTVVEYGGDHLRYNLFLEYADVSLAGGALRHSLRDGLYAVHSTAAISGTAFSQNGGYAALFEQASGDLDLHNLSASQNGHDGIALKSTTLTGAHTWEDGGVPYLLAGVVGVHHVGTAPGSTLTIEPGVVVQSEGVGFYVEGQLQAVGTAVSPILFTADTPTAGSWDGLHIQGTTQAPNTGSTLAYVTVAYGGQYKSANLHLDWAAATITHCTFRDAVSLGAFPVHGILAADSTAVIRDSHFANNHDYAVYFSALSADPVLENLTAAGNGTDGIALIHSDLAGAHRWEASGLPYYLLGQVDVLAGAELTVAPGVEVRAAGSPLDVAGTLRAIGTAARPITFTAISQTPGDWGGIRIYGTAAAPNEGSILRHVTIEYAGWNGNLQLTHANAAISDSRLRYSSADGLELTHAAGTYVARSQFVGNAAYGIQNNRPQELILADYNWWGDASGPAHPACNPAGTGDAVSDGVVFRPFLTLPNTAPGPLPPGEARILTLQPLRWFAPADGTTQVWVEITLRDGSGQPLPGRTVNLNSSLGTVVDGGITDITGRTFAYLTANAEGTAVLAAVLDYATTCEWALSPTAEVTFSALADDPLLPGAAAPYMNGRINLAPLPLQVGTPAMVSADLVNPNDFPITVDATFGIAQAGIGLTFGPIGSVTGVRIEANSSRVIGVPWTPLVPGHVCIEVQYAAASIPGEPRAPEIDWFNSGQSQRNSNILPANFNNYDEHTSIDDFQDTMTDVSNGQTILQLITSPLETIFGLATPDAGDLFGYIQDNNLNLYKKAGLAIQYAGTDRGPYAPQYYRQPAGPGITPQIISGPRQDYTVYALLDSYSFPPLTAGGNLSAAWVAAANAWLEASLRLEAQFRAAVLSAERFAGAVAASDQQWAAQQAAAYLYYKAEMAVTMLEVADRTDAFLAMLHDEGIDQAVLLPETYADYQARLQASGFDATEVAAARVFGLTDAEIELLRQERIAADPAVMAGDVIPPLAEMADVLRGWSAAITGGGTRQAAVTDTLASLAESGTTFLVGNPFTRTVTVTLQVRRVDVPADWAVRVTPRQVTLQPGEQALVTVAIRPGSRAVRQTQPRVAVEGYVDGELLGGMLLAVSVPEAAVFDGLLRLYLPAILRP